MLRHLKSTTNLSLKPLKITLKTKRKKIIIKKELILNYSKK